MFPSDPYLERDRERERWEQLTLPLELAPDGHGSVRQ